MFDQSQHRWQAKAGLIFSLVLVAGVSGCGREAERSVAAEPTEPVAVEATAPPEVADQPETTEQPEVTEQPETTNELPALDPQDPVVRSLLERGYISDPSEAPQWLAKNGRGRVVANAAREAFGDDFVGAAIDPHTHQIEVYVKNLDKVRDTFTEPERPAAVRDMPPVNLIDVQFDHYDFVDIISQAEDHLADLEYNEQYGYDSDTAASTLWVLATEDSFDEVKRVVDSLDMPMVKMSTEVWEPEYVQTLEARSTDDDSSR